MEKLTCAELEILDRVKRYKLCDSSLGEFIRLFMLAGSVYLGSRYGEDLILIVGVAGYLLIRLYDLIMHCLFTQELRRIVGKLKEMQGCRQALQENCE